MGNWLLWTIPHQYVRRYLFTLWLVLFFLPNRLNDMSKEGEAEKERRES